MGTMLHISASGADQAQVEHAVAAALAAVQCVERLLSFHDPASELTRLNQHAARVPQRVHAWTYALLRRALRLSELSDGVFDVSVAPWLVQAGLLPGELRDDAVPGNWRDVQLLPQQQVFFQRPLQLDLGGIAKGFAVDQAIHALRCARCQQAMVNAGGDLRCFGDAPQLIQVRNGDALTPLAHLRSGALATSTPHSMQTQSQGQLGCIVDPRQGRAWQASASVSVAARTCLIADALTKVAALAGSASEPILRRFGAQAFWHSR